MTEPIDVLFVGRTGVGKSTLINMIRHGDETALPARVTNDANACTLQTTSYPIRLDPGLHCLLWDTRGLDEAADNRDRLMLRILHKIRQLGSQQERELKEAIRSRIRTARSILMWCIDATKIETTVHWLQFRKVYVEYCEERAIPVVIITNMTPKMDGWEPKCRRRLQEVELGNTEVYLLSVRKHRNLSSSEYAEDGERLKDLIFRLANQINANQSPT